MRSWGWGPQMGLVPLWQEKLEHLCYLFHYLQTHERKALPPNTWKKGHMRTQQEGSVCKPERESSPETDSVGSWSGISNIQNGKKINVYRLSQPVFDVLLWQPKLTKTIPLWWGLASFLCGFQAHPVLRPQCWLILQAKPFRNSKVNPFALKCLVLASHSVLLSDSSAWEELQGLTWGLFCLSMPQWRERCEATWCYLPHRNNALDCHWKSCLVMWTDVK